MKRLNLFYAGLFAVISAPAFAQVNQTPVHSNGNQIFVTAEKELEATGSMFINDKYMPAKISGTDTTVLLRYNAYSDQFEISNPQEQSVKPLSEQNNTTISFVSSGDAYALENYKTEDKEEITGYLNIISDGSKVKIYKRERIYLQPGKASRNSYQTAQAPSYKRAEDEYYAKIGNATEASFFDGKKEFSKLIPGKEKEVLEYIKKNNIDIEKATDLQKLAAYVETIL
jgi:hypothetical protein